MLPSLLYDVEFDDNLDKELGALGVADGTMLNVEDDMQDYKVEIRISHATSFSQEDAVFDIVSGDAAPRAQQPAEAASKPASSAATASEAINLDDDVMIISAP